MTLLGLFWQQPGGEGEGAWLLASGVEGPALLEASVDSTRGVTGRFVTVCKGQLSPRSLIFPHPPAV